MLRAVVAAPATIRHRFLTAPGGTPAVTAATLDGSAVTIGAAQDTDADDVWEAVIAAADMPDVPDQLTVTWDAGGGHVETDLVDVTVGRLVNPAVVAAGRGLDSASALTVAEVSAAVEDAIEEYTGRAWMRRVHVETHHLDGYDVLWLRKQDVHALRSVTIDGTAATTSAWTVDASGRVAMDRTVAASEPLVATYEYGVEQVPIDLTRAATRAAMQLAREELDRHTSQRTEFAEGASWLIATASLDHGRLFGIPSVDAVINLHERRRQVVG